MLCDSYIHTRLVRVAHEGTLDVLGNDSVSQISTREAHKLRAIPGTAPPPLPNKSTGTARTKKASLVQSCCKTDREPSSSCTTSYGAQANWGPAEDTGHHNQDPSSDRESPGAHLDLVNVSSELA